MTEEVTLQVGGRDFDAYVAAPDAGAHPGIILIEEIWGVSEHIKDVARRFMNEGFAVVAPELLGETGILEAISPAIFAEMQNPETAHAAQAKMRAAMAPVQEPTFAVGAMQKLRVSIDYLLAQPQCNGKIAAVGFCFGGTYSYHLAVQEPRVLAAVPFYGHPPTAEEILDISCPILAFYGEEDANLMGTLPQLKEDMLKLGKDFTAVVYPNAGHAFFNDTREQAYREGPAKDAWVKTLEFLHKHVG